MAPQHLTDQSVHSSASSSSSLEIITTSLFGLCAVIIGIITIWQGKKLRAIWTRSFGDYGLQYGGSTMAYELDDTRIESDIGPEIPLQAFAASIDSHNEIHAPPANPSVEGSPRATSVQPDGQNDVLTPLGPEACTTPLPDEGPTAFECCDGQLTSDSSPSLSGARPVLSGGQNFESTVAM